jgi:putative thioredoxin
MAQQFGNVSVASDRAKREPGNAEAQYQLGVVLAAQGEYQQALQALLKAAETDRKLGSATVREAMVKVFQAIGTRSPLADEYRDKLAKILY